ncbi:MAG: phospholipase [Acidobacteria bacterium]|nr:MAG: phospholipase [Acidobacteriota bacterium]PIE91046.1 MAG: phospholipase [Acidobacteriota bacterium]
MCFLLLVVLGSLPSQRVMEEFKDMTFTVSSKALLPYRLLEPLEIGENETYPLILFLHGAGERGQDNQKQLIHCSEEILAFSKKQGRKFYFLAPQCPLNQRWVDVDWSRTSMTMPKDPTDPMLWVMELLGHILENKPIDRDRIYVCGLSMGGFGTWDLLMRKPDLFAAAIPICGGGDPNAVDQIKHIPIWTFHGAKDQTVSPFLTRKVVQALKKVDGRVLYTEYPDAAHNCWTRTFKNDKVWKWLLDKRKG